MTTSEVIRVALILILIIVLVLRSGKFRKKLMERRREKEREEAKQQRLAERKEAKRKRRDQLLEKREQTAKILRSNLEALQQKSVKAAGFELFYLEGGDSRQPTVLLLHGFAGIKEDWTACANFLVAEGFHVVAPDLPGFGQTVKNPDLQYDVTTQAKRIRALAQKLGLTPSHLVGSSLGGSIAATYAYGAADEVSSLTLIEPFGVRVPHESELDQWLKQDRNPLAIAAPAAYENLLGFLFVEPPAWSEALKQVRAEQIAHNRSFYLKVWQEIRTGEKAYLLDQLLPAIRHRTLVLQGGESKVVHPSTAEMIGRRMKQVQVVVLEGCGHFPAVERPREAAEHLVSFLKASATPSA